MVLGYNISKYRNLIAFLDSRIANSKKKKNSFIIATQSLRGLRINVIKYVQNLYGENLQPFLKDLERRLISRNGEIQPVQRWENSIL